MYLPRDLFSHLYQQLQRRWHAQQSPLVLLVALEPDALCASRILTALLKRDYISHNIIPVAGYSDLARAGEENVQPMRTQNGGSGGTVICLGVGGLVDLASVLGVEPADEHDDATGGVEIWVMDARRPWNLGNVFAGKPPPPAALPLEEVSGNAPRTRTGVSDVSRGEIQRNYRAGKGGIIVFDDGDISAELQKERDAFFELEALPPVEDDYAGDDSSDSESEAGAGAGAGAGRTSEPRTKKRKSLSDAEDQENEDDHDESEDGRPRQRRRSNSSSSIPVPTERPARRVLLSTSTDIVPSSFPSRSPSPSHEPTSYQAKPESMRRKRRRVLRLKRQYEDVLYTYYTSGTSYSEPISSMMYSLVSELGREDNNMLWNAIVGVSSLELYGRTMTGVGISDASEAGGSAGWGGERGEAIRQVLADEVRRLNPPDSADGRMENARGSEAGVIPTTARSPNDHAIRLSPEPRFLLIRHWSLYDSMLHSPYLAARLHMWTEHGQRRLDKFLAKMGVSLSQSKQSYTHMDMDLKKDLRQRLLKYAPAYGLDGLVPPPPTAGRGKEGWGFVRSWGWQACLSAVDVGVIIGAILEIGKGGVHINGGGEGSHRAQSQSQTETVELVDEHGRREGEEYVSRFWDAYDALGNIQTLLKALPPTQHLHRAIHRTGTALLSKRQIRHLRAFRMGVVKDGPDVQLFTHPGALTKLALWVGEALAQQEKDAAASMRKAGHTPLVLAGLNESRGVYVVVGTGGGGGVVEDGRVAKRAREERNAARAKRRDAKAAEKQSKKAEKQRKKDDRAAARAEREEDDAANEEEDDDDDETEDEDDDEEDESEDEEEASGEAGKKGRRNRFGQAFQEVAEETGARVRIDSFEHCVMEVQKDDLGRFLEALSQKAVVG